MGRTDSCIKKMITFHILIFTAAFSPSSGQLAEYLHPTAASQTRNLIQELANQPIFQMMTQMSGDLLAEFVEAISRVPAAVSRALSPSNQQLKLYSKSNTVELVDQFIEDYSLGLGNEDAKLPIEALVTKYGYSIEKHQVITEDGYILTMFRIPGDGPSVFLMHGLLGSSDDFVIAGVRSGIAYLLANEGYDVWLGNARGTKHSRENIKMHPSEAEFWDFTWHEIGIYDLPAMIDYILYETGERTLKYIGHSQGTTSFYVMASKRPEYNGKIAQMISLSPVAFFNKVRSPVVRLLSPGGPVFRKIVQTFGLYEFLPDNALMRNVKLFLCGFGPIAEILCTSSVFLVTGIGYAQLNVTNLPVIIGHEPAGAAAKQFFHYAQGVISGDFTEFDYGAMGNLRKYGSALPPRYALENIKTPVSLFYSDTDWLAAPEDVGTLYSRLPNVLDVYKVPCPQFMHLDFIFAKDLEKLIFRRVRRLLTLF